MQKILLFVALILLMGWLVMRILRGKPGPARTPVAKVSDQSSPYHAVSIQYSSNACDAAKAMTGRRFLASAAPRLPLPDCDSLECRCLFTHHSDRRAGSDRRSPFRPGGIGSSGTGSGTFKAERRQKKDRRENADLDNSK